jgi:hypothetical protein
MIDFTCPKCGAAMHAQDAMAGGSLTCRACGNVTLVPAPQVPPPLPGAHAYDDLADEPMPEFRKQPNVPGIISLVLGIIAFVISWMMLFPKAAIGVAFFGAVLAIAGLMLSKYRKNVSYTVAIAGGGCCLAAIVISVYMHTVVYPDLFSGFENDLSYEVNEAKRETDLSAIRAVLELYRAQTDDFPTSLAALEGTVTAKGFDGESAVFGPWLEVVPLDPWDEEPYEYRRINSNSYILEGETYGS